MPEEAKTTTVYGVEVVAIPDEIQVLDVIVIAKGVILETGAPTVTTQGSEGMTPWEVIGLLEMEAFRQKMMMAIGAQDMDDDEEEEE